MTERDRNISELASIIHRHCDQTMPAPTAKSLFDALPKLREEAPAILAQAGVGFEGMSVGEQSDLTQAAVEKAAFRMTSSMHLNWLQLTYDEAKYVLLFFRDDGTALFLPEATYADILEYKKRLDEDHEQLRRDLTESRHMARRLGISPE